MRLALFQPDIPQNTGTIMRLCACLGVPLDIIEPCGFVLEDRRLRRSGMDYMENVDMTRHTSFNAFLETHKNARRVLVETDGKESLYDFKFQPGDILILGRESGGVTQDVYDNTPHSVFIPMQTGFRSMNVAIAGAIALSEALRQIHK